MPRSSPEKVKCSGQANPPLVSVVTVNWNGREHLEVCLPALLAQTYRPLEIIVVDNGSSDGSAQMVERNFPQVKLIRSVVNLGFAAGSNLGIRASRGDYLATLNNDTLPEPQWLEELVSAMHSNPDVGMCASNVLSWDGQRSDSAGISLDRAGIAWERKAGRSGEPGREPVEVFGPTAAAALYRKAMLDEVGLFDERFFCYLEDVDLAWRARGMRWRCLYVPTARVSHRHSATAGEGSPFKRYLLARNKAWLIAKNYPWPQILIYLPALLAFDLISMLYALVYCTPSLRAKLAVLRGRLDALLGLRQALKDRQEVQRRRRLTPYEMLSLMDPLPTPWSSALTDGQRR